MQMTEWFCKIKNQLCRHKTHKSLKPIIVVASFLGIYRHRNPTSLPVCHKFFRTIFLLFQWFFFFPPPPPKIIYIKWKVLWKEIFQLIVTCGEKTVLVTKYLGSCTIILSEDVLLHYRKLLNFNFSIEVTDLSVYSCKSQKKGLGVQMTAVLNHSTVV